MRLTDKACKNIKPDKKPRKLADGDGLYLHVMPGGGKYWRFNYRFAGKHKTLAIGVYPEVPLAEAREKRQSARKQLRDGIDPSFAKREGKRQLALSAENNFEAVAREWHQHSIEKWSESHAGFILHRLEADVFSAIGRLPIKDITAPHLLSVIRTIENRGAHETARKITQTCGQIFRYAIVTGRAERNIAADLRGALKPFKKGHFAALEAKDLPEFLEKLHRNDARLFVLTRLAVEMLMLTFVRTSELIEAKWEEFDLEKATWAIPAERMKMRRLHIVPLAKQVLAILAQIRAISGNREYVFPNQAKPLKHMSNNTVLFALGRMGYKGKATGHGFRALAMSTIKEQLGYRHEVVDRQLAHAHRNSVDAAYDRAKFLNERRKMMQEWADYLDAVASDKKVIVGKFCNAD
jgi:integrase